MKHKLSKARQGLKPLIGDTSLGDEVRLNDSASFSNPKNHIVYLDAVVPKYEKSPFSGQENNQETMSPLQFNQVKLDFEQPAVVVFPKLPRQDQDRFESLQALEGNVIEVLEDSFVARLIDTTGKGPDQEAEIPFAETTEEDRDLIQPGSIFYWDIGYDVRKGGQRIRCSLIQFRRLPAWTSRELKANKSQAERLRKEIGWT